MLITSVFILIPVLGTLMAADWYLWDPRLRNSGSAEPQGHNGKPQILRNAA